MKETGRIVSVEGPECQVEFNRSSACESCGACNRFGDSTMRVTMKNTLDGHTGDRVVVEMGAKNVIGASIWAYIFPLFMLILGAYVGKLSMSWFSIQEDWIVAIAALLFAAMAYGILRLLNPYFSKKQGLNPVMVEIYTSDGK